MRREKLSRNFFKLFPLLACLRSHSTFDPQRTCGVFPAHTLIRVCLLSLLSCLICLNTGCRNEAPGLKGQINGNSMEPNFAGTRAYFTCGQCQLNSYFSPPPSREASEPHCPRCNSPVQVTRSMPGAMVSYQSVLDSKALAIGDVIVFDPMKTATVDDSIPRGIQIKRIAALPGQSLAIRWGDLWIDGFRQMATLDQFQSRSIPVDNYSQFSDGLANATSPPWIAYVPSSLYPRKGDQFKRHLSCMLDESWWDLQESRELVPVHDYGIDFRLETPIESNAEFNLDLQARSCDRVINVHITRQANSPLHIDCVVSQKESSTEKSFDADSRDLSRRCQVAIVDGNLRIRFDREEFVLPIPECKDNGPLSEDTSVNEQTTEFGFVSLPAITDQKFLFASQLRKPLDASYQIILRRDIFYRGPKGELEYDLPSVNGFQVLGDHVAASVDSRQSYPEGIPAAAIAGRVCPNDCQ